MGKATSTGGNGQTKRHRTKREACEVAAAHFGLCWRVARDLYYRAPRGMTLEDLAMAGFPALMRSVELFNPDRGVKFSTYAYRAIRSRITRAMLTWRELPAQPTGDPETWARPQAMDSSTLDATIAGREADPEAKVETTDLLAVAAEILTGRERRVLSRYCRDETLQAVGDELGISRERVRQIEVQARERVRRYFAARNGGGTRVARI